MRPVPQLALLPYLLFIQHWLEAAHGLLLQLPNEEEAHVLVRGIATGR